MFALSSQTSFLHVRAAVVKKMAAKRCTSLVLSELRASLYCLQQKFVKYP